ncbi:hypothetical protein GCM10017643_01580 [Ancylobacter dichloromethanicus]|uniref:Uncharacterized protein n=1 Tax=Ancylobacter dichloromethanicus TaxID=518825 RepID=A0A9W6J666_9HYPH|nr:hypothetical protein GCM10017643_01580 [Ancylobacter dichloromethanicus]
MAMLYFSLGKIPERAAQDEPPAKTLPVKRHVPGALSYCSYALSSREVYSSARKCFVENMRPPSHGVRFPNAAAAKMPTRMERSSAFPARMEAIDRVPGHIL